MITQICARGGIGYHKGLRRLRFGFEPRRTHQTKKAPRGLVFFGYIRKARTHPPKMFAETKKALSGVGSPHRLRWHERFARSCPDGHTNKKSPSWAFFVGHFRRVRTHPPKMFALTKKALSGVGSPHRLRWHERFARSCPDGHTRRKCRRNFRRRFVIKKPFPYRTGTVKFLLSRAYNRH